VYDGTRAATVSTSGAVLIGKIAGDNITVSATGSFADANVGTSKTVALTNSYGGADAGNYTITHQASTTADITAAPAPTTTSSTPMVQNTVTQVQASVRPPLATTQPMLLNLSPTITVAHTGENTATTSSGGETAPKTTGTQLVNTISTIGGLGPTLQIVNGGTKLPENGNSSAINTKEQRL